MPFFGHDDDAPAEDRPMTLSEHLDELRKRVFWCVLIAAAFCVACAFVEDALLGIALQPANSVIQEMNSQPEFRALKLNSFVATEVGEKFFTGMKVDIVVGLFFAAPMMLYLLWGFVARGLHPREKRFVHIFAPISYLLFVGDCVFFYFVIQPVTLRFLLTYHMSDVFTPGGDQVTIPSMLRIESTIGFFLSMTLVTGLIFELPLVMLFLQAIRICTWRTYVKFWAHFLFGLVVFSAVITPTGDAFTLVLFMAPVLTLFFGGVLVCRIMAPKDT
jgi:Tat protein translocase TatC